MMKKDLRSPLAKAKGLGASGSGSHHFWLQRMTALALIPIIMYLVFSIALIPEASYSAVIAWLQAPFNAIMMALLVVVSFQHAHLGLQVILEDYLSNHSTRLIAIIAVKFISYFMMAAGLYAIIKITLGGH